MGRRVQDTPKIEAITRLKIYSYLTPHFIVRESRLKDRG